MVLRITRGRFLPPTTDLDVQRIVEGLVVPVMQSLPGFQHYYGGVNRETSMIIAASYWDTAEDARFSRDVFLEAMPALAAIGVTLEPAEVYDIMVDV